MTVILHQFPLSHYCEKVRWALDYKGIPWQAKNHLPGLHLKKVSAMAPASSVPVLQLGAEVVQGSAAIISFLDQRFPDNPLTPADTQLQRQALEWEQYCDEDIGPHVRRYCYHTLLDHPDIVIPFFAQGGPFWGRLFLKAIFPKLQAVMRKHMRIREPHVSASREHLEAAMAKLASVYAERAFLVGDTFTRADLAAASLLAPLFQPVQYGLQWPARLPEPLQGWMDNQRSSLQAVSRLYADWR